MQQSTDSLFGSLQRLHIWHPSYIYGSLRRAIAQLFRKNLQLASSLLIMRTCSAALSHLSLQCAETCDDPAASSARRPDCEVADSSWLPVAAGCWRGLPCGPPPAGLGAPSWQRKCGAFQYIKFCRLCGLLALFIPEHNWRHTSTYGAVPY